MYDFYPDAVKRECLHAYKAYLLTETIFMHDRRGLGPDKQLLRKSIKNKFRDLRKALLEDDGIYVDFFNTYAKETKEEKGKLTSFLYELYNVLTMAVYLDLRYTSNTKTSKLNKQLLSNNLAMSIIEGSTIGRYYDFNPYFSRSNGSEKEEREYGVQHKMIFSEDFSDVNKHDDFYYAQNSFLLHQLLMLVVLYNKSEILPKIHYSKVGQKNITEIHIKDTSDTIPSDFLDDYQWCSSLVNIIKNFDFIMTDLKRSNKSPFSAKLANIFFSKEFIDNFNFKEMLESYVFKEDLLIDNSPTKKRIADTIGRIIDSKIQKYTDKKDAWLITKDFMALFPYQVGNRKYNKIDFSYGEHIICIFNNDKAFGIGTHRDFKNPQKSARLTYMQVQDKYKRPFGSNSSLELIRAMHYNVNTYVFYGP